MSKHGQRRLADERKAALVASGHNYRSLARLADVSYSMAEKWMNARRTSRECQRAFDALTNGAREKVS